MKNNHFFCQKFCMCLVLFCKMMNQNPNFFRMEGELNTPLVGITNIIILSYKFNQTWYFLLSKIFEISYNLGWRECSKTNHGAHRWLNRKTKKNVKCQRDVVKQMQLRMGKMFSTLSATTVWKCWDIQWCWLLGNLKLRSAASSWSQPLRTRFLEKKAAAER